MKIKLYFLPWSQAKYGQNIVVRAAVVAKFEFLWIRVERCFFLKCSKFGGMEVEEGGSFEPNFHSFENHEVKQCKLP